MICHVSKMPLPPRHPPAAPPIRIWGDGGGDAADGRAKLTSQHEFAIWQPAWPTRRVHRQYQQIAPGRGGRSGQGARGRVGRDAPFKLITSLMVDGVRVEIGVSEWVCGSGSVCVLVAGRMQWWRGVVLMGLAASLKTAGDCP